MNTINEMFYTFFGALWGTAWTPSSPSPSPSPSASPRCSSDETLVPDNSTSEVKTEQQEWESQIIASINQFSLLILDNFSSQKSEHPDTYSIVVRRTESWESVHNRLDNICYDYVNMPEVVKWATKWNVQVTNLKALAYKREISRRQYEASLFSPHESLKEEHKKSLNIANQHLQEKLDFIHKKIQKQINNPKYKTAPYKEFLEYLDNNWQALTIFLEKPGTPLDIEGVFLDLTTPNINTGQGEGVGSGTNELNSGRPLIFSLKQSSGPSWRLGVQSADIPHPKKQFMEQISKTVDDILRTKLTIKSSEIPNTTQRLNKT